MGCHLVHVGAAATPPSLVLGSVCVMNDCSPLNRDLNTCPIVQLTHYSSGLCTSPSATFAQFIAAQLSARLPMGMSQC